MSFGLEWLVRRLIGKVAGGMVDAITGGDPLDPENDREDDEERVPDPVFRQSRVVGLVSRERFREVIDGIDARLERGFRETQKEVLGARAGKLKEGGNFVLLCNVFHGGVPTSMQIAVRRSEAGVHAVLAEGRGPALGVVRGVFREFEMLVEAERDGIFHAEEGMGWVARLPAERGTFLGQEVDAVVEHGWPGLPADGEISDAVFLERIFGSLGTVLAGAEEGFRRFVDDVEVLSDVSDPVLVFPAGAAEAEEWYLQISRSNWPSFRWRIQFEGDRAMDIRAGN